MKRWFPGGWLTALALMTAATAMAGIPVPTPVTVAATVWGTPYGVRAQAGDEGVRVSGEVRAAVIHPGRRLAGRVWVEVLDANGAVLAADHGEVRRMTPARHNSRGRFEVDLGPLPPQAASLRVIYRGP